MEEEKEKKKK